MQKSIKTSFIIFFTGLILFTVFGNVTCKYGFRDAAPIPDSVKTFRVNYFENKAQYINTQLSPELTEKTKQKIIGNTKLRQTNDDDAHYDISGYISQYYASTVGVSNNEANSNRLTVGFHLIFKNTLDNTKDFETDLITNIDFPANQTLTDIESTRTPDMVKNLTELIFTKIFSNW